MDELLVKHRKEIRDLQSQITHKKKSATKKNRKTVNAECEALELQLQQKHTLEVSQINHSTPVDSTPVESEHDLDDLAEPAEAADDHSPGTDNLKEGARSKVTFDLPHDEPTEATPGRRPNRQKARLARRAAEQEAEAARAVEEAAKLPDPRREEREIMNREIKKRGLVEKDIRPDGHCLYSAVADQLATIKALSEAHDSATGLNHPLDYRNTRSAAAKFILEHPDDFVPFLEEPLDDYIQKVENTAEWGGQLELQALARHYGIAVNVLQGDGRVERLEADGGGTGEIWLAYYRHTFGLGEHYNSLQKAP